MENCGRGGQPSFYKLCLKIFLISNLYQKAMSHEEAVPLGLGGQGGTMSLWRKRIITELFKPKSCQFLKIKISLFLGTGNESPFCLNYQILKASSLFGCLF